MLRLEAEDKSNDDTKNDVNIIYEGSGSDEIVMILDEFLATKEQSDFTIDNFESL